MGELGTRSVTRDVVDTVLGFARTLRHAGVTASPDRVEAMLAALGSVLKEREDLELAREHLDEITAS